MSLEYFAATASCSDTARCNINVCGTCLSVKMGSNPAPFVIFYPLSGLQN